MLVEDVECNQPYERLRCRGHDGSEHGHGDRVVVAGGIRLVLQRVLEEEDLGHLEGIACECAAAVDEQLLAR